MAVRGKLELDWSRWYSDSSRWPISRDIFLADAVFRLGEKMVFPFLPEMLEVAHLPLLQDIPSADIAFDRKGEPVAAIHDAWAPLVLRNLAAAEFHGRRIEKADPVAFAAAQTYDDESGTVRFDPLKAGINADAVTIDHWSSVEIDIADRNNRRDAALLALKPVARTIARMALTGHIKTFARRIDGVGEDVPLGADVWEISDPLPRLASCGLDITAPRAVDKYPTHLIYVRKENFEEATWIAVRNNQISLIEEGITPEDMGMVGPKPSRINAELKKRAYDILRDHILARPGDCTRPELKAVLDRAIGPIGDKMFEGIRNKLRDEFPHMRIAGSPVGNTKREAAGQGGAGGRSQSNVLPFTPLSKETKGNPRT